MKNNSQTCKISKRLHEINQPLTAFKTNLSGCELRLQKNHLSPEPMANDLQNMQYTESLQNKIYSMPDLRTQDNFTDTHSMDVLVAEINSLYSYELEYYNVGLIMDFHKATPYSMKRAELLANGICFQIILDQDR
ncbi:hypothetical protein OQJ13_12900 [Legionella sp. PATHC035]|uniref:hypothetical protein n=1 Tax=Legionella sp. PATHC035 TaxID=2992040 RepID=UPI002243DA46|nr:hypothetical protein [Legionella sp. PATHC035]MCW8409870.1 hypothetical protein [Legionella sp. PATHC035]